MAAAERSDITALFTTYIQPQAIPTLENELVLCRLGVPKPIPANSGDTTQVQFPANLTSSTVPVSELATGFANQLSYTTATMRVFFYANDIQFSKLVDAINEVNYRDSAFGRLAYNAAETADLICRDALDDMTTNVQVVNDKTVGTDLAATDILNVSEINDATTTLRVANVRSHPMFPGAYALVIHNRNAGDLRGDTGGGSNPNALTWYDQHRRGDQSMLDNALIGRTMGAEVLETSAIQNLTDGNSINYYNCFMIGDNLFMTGQIGGLNGAPETREAGGGVVSLIPPEVSQATPFGNRYILAWNYYTGAGLIDDNRGVLLQAASAA